VFRALAPLFVTTFPNGSVALPIIGAGDQGWPADQMLDSILRAAVSWLRRGLPIHTAKIVVFSEPSAQLARQKFLELQQADSEHAAAGQQRNDKDIEQTGESQLQAYDVFVSYCHDDSDAAKYLVDSVRRCAPSLRIFHDEKVFRPGQSWLLEIAESLDSARRVAALFTPHYWSSRYCKDEFSAALARQHDTGKAVLFPIYVRSVNIPYLFRSLQYVDCREADLVKLNHASAALCSTLV
jgi:TIR domain